MLKQDSKHAQSDSNQHDYGSHKNYLEDYSSKMVMKDKIRCGNKSLSHGAASFKKTFRVAIR